MRIGKKRAWLALALVAVAATTAVWWMARNRVPPVILTLPDGTQYRFVGVTFGTKNTPPIFLARLADWLPTNLAKYVRNHAGTRLNQFNQGRNYPEPRYFVWFEKTGSNAAPANATLFYATLSDEAGAVGGMLEGATFSSTVTWADLSFLVFPKRSRIIQLNLHRAPPGIMLGESLPATVARVRFPNPLYGDYPQWRPEPLPVVKQVGDLEVRLENFGEDVTADLGLQDLKNGQQGIGDWPSSEDQGATAYVDLSAQSTRDTNEAWVVQAYALSDATGNVISGPSKSVVGENLVSPVPYVGEHRFSLEGILWPGEDAWRLKLELKRKTGFRPDELMTFSKLPVLAAGTISTTPITNMFGGVKVVLNPIRVAPAGSGYMLMGIRAELPDHPGGVTVDLVKLTTDAGDELKATRSSWTEYQRFFFLPTLPTNAKTVDLTLVVQKTRSVEFLVKPPKNQ